MCGGSTLEEATDLPQGRLRGELMYLKSKACLKSETAFL